MNIKKYIVLGVAFFASYSLTSCDDILDVDPIDSFTDAAVWGDLSLAEAYLNSSYTRVIAEVRNGECTSGLFIS